jgi:Polysaccharide lyase
VSKACRTVQPRRPRSQLRNCAGFAAVAAVLAAFVLGPTAEASAYGTLTEGRFVEETWTAPGVLALGDLLSWEPVGSSDAYVLRRKVPGRATEFALVRNLVVQPPAIAGATVVYSVKSVLGGNWSPNVFITYPPTLGAEATSGEGLTGVQLSETGFFGKTAVAPTLGVAEGVLRWDAIDPTGYYVLRRNVPGQISEYALVNDTSVLPPPIAGQSVRYAVKSALGSLWSPEITVTNPPAAGEALWRGDGTQPLYEQWASMADQEHCAEETGASNLPDSRISLVGDARFAKGVAIHYHMNAGDTGCFSGRSELIGGARISSPPNLISAGDEGWYAFQILFPTTYPLNSAVISDGGVMQFHGYGGSGGVPFGISCGRVEGAGSGAGTPHPGGSELGYLHSWRTTSTSGTPYENHLLSTEIHANTVYDILIHARFSRESDGFLEIFLDGTNVQTYHGQFGLLANAEHSIIHSGLYPGTQRSETPPMDLYEGGWTLASTREAAEAGAF